MASEKVANIGQVLLNVSVQWQGQTSKGPYLVDLCFPSHTRYLGSAICGRIKVAGVYLTSENVCECSSSSSVLKSFDHLVTASISTARNPLGLMTQSQETTKLQNVVWGI